MWTAEVAANEVWLTLAPVEVPAGPGGEFGLVAGLAVHRKAPFEIGVDQLVGAPASTTAGNAVRCGSGVGHPSAFLAGAVCEAAVPDEVHLAVGVACTLAQEAAHDVGVDGLDEDCRPGRRKGPRRPRPAPSPGSPATPIPAGHAPPPGSPRRPACPGPGTTDPSGAGTCLPPARSAAPGTGSRSGPPHQHAPTAAPPAPGHRAGDPARTAGPPAARPHPAPDARRHGTRTAEPRAPHARGRPPRPPVVHGLERDQEHRRDTLASPARRQRVHRPQPKGLRADGDNCRASPTSSLTQASTTQVHHSPGEAVTASPPAPRQ